MRSIETILENRNNLRKSILKINNELRSVKSNAKTWEELSKEDKKMYGILFSLKSHYLDQEKGLNFLLNEDSKLDDYRWNSVYSGLEEYFVEVNVK